MPVEAALADTASLTLTVVMKKASIFISLLLLSSCATPHVESATQPTAQTQPDAQNDALTTDLIMPDDTAKTPSGFAYTYLYHGQGEAFSPTSALRIRLRASDIVTGKAEETVTVMTPDKGGPFFGEVLGELKLGDRVRVWGESEGRVWDIEVLEIAHEYDPPEDLTPPVEASELNGAKWILLEPGSGEKITHGQAAKFHATRWSAKTGEVLESTLAGNGMLAILNNEMFYRDPVHAALLLELSPGAHARVWIDLPGTQPDDPSVPGFDIIEDVWLVDHMKKYDIPSELAHPDNARLIKDGAWMRIENAPLDDSVPLLKKDDEVSVDMTCWNSDNASLIMSSDLTDQPTIMHLDENLGIWLDIMLNARRGMTFRTWTTPDVMPDAVGMNMTCLVTVD